MNVTEKQNLDLNQEKNNLEKQRNQILNKLSDIKTQQNKNKEVIDHIKMYMRNVTENKTKKTNKKKWYRFFK